MRTKWRYYYHWVRQTGNWSVHFRNQCTHRPHLTCKVEAETKINKTQPYRVMQGYASEVEITEDRIIIK